MLLEPVHRCPHISLAPALAIPCLGGEAGASMRDGPTPLERNS